MTKLDETYTVAVQQTKQKLIEDIDRFFERKDDMPSYNEYVEERKMFIEQIWINVWINKASNDVPKKEKKQFLRAKGYETDGVDKKVINKLFRNELKNERQFDVISWLNDRFENNPDDWQMRYHRTIEAYQKRQAARLIEKERTNYFIKLQKWVDTYIENNFLLLYLPIRHYAAKQLQKDLNKNQKFKYIEPFRLEEKLAEDGHLHPTDYSTVATFFEELTGGVQSSFDWGRHSFEYETYYDYYEKLLLEFVYEVVPKKVIENLPTAFPAEYRELYHVDLTEGKLIEWMDNQCFDLTVEFLHELAEEYLEDVLEIAETPLDEAKHLALFERNLANRERKKAEEQVELERKKVEEARILDDIFGKAYIPSIGMNIRYVLHIGETNTGKTHHALKTMKAAESGLYLAPLRLLALEVYDKLNQEGIPCSLKTGEEEKVVNGASHISCTVEMFHEKDFYEVVVIDEAQMLADKDRGFSWYKAITKANAREVHIIGSWNIKDLLCSLLEEAEMEVHEYARDTPLEIEQKEFELNHTKKGDALICFSRKRVLETAGKLKRNGHSVSMIYGSMPPETRKKQIELFNSGQTKVVVATDAIGMGLNLPIRRIVFLETEKFDGTRRRKLASQEVKQIAGRAGRKGIYDVGKVVFSSDIKHMSKLLEKNDEPVETFAIAPTSNVFERFQQYYHDLGTFFELWEKFEAPKGTKKASLVEERELYELIQGTAIEASFSMMDLYGFLHLPFSAKEPVLVRQWLETMMAIVDNHELPEPVIKRKELKDFELSYKAIGLHLLFLYRIGKRTEAVYWERIREEISDGVHDQLKNEVENYQKKCKKCGKPLPDDSRFAICDSCYFGEFRRGRRR